MSLHQRTHPVPVDGCGPCKWASINIGAEALPTRRPGIAKANQREWEWGEDNAAYKRLRRNGLQPKTVNGAATAEAKATHELEVEHMRPLPKQIVSRIEEGNAISKELGMVTP